jgi:hypothetical protein
VRRGGVANVGDARVGLLALKEFRRRRHAPSGHNQFAPRSGVAHDRRRVIGVDARERRKVASVVLDDAKECRLTSSQMVSIRSGPARHWAKHKHVISGRSQQAGRIARNLAQPHRPVFWLEDKFGFSLIRRTQPADGSPRSSRWSLTWLASPWAFTGRTCRATAATRRASNR